MKKVRNTRPKKPVTDVRLTLTPATARDTLRELEALSEVKTLTVFPNGIVRIIPTTPQALARLHETHLPALADKLTLISQDDDDEAPEEEPDEIEELES